MEYIYLICIYMIISAVYYCDLCLCDTFIVPNVLSDYEESFVFNGMEYIFSSRRVTWDEAEVFCSTTDSSSLAIVNRTEKARFLAEALSETNLDVEDLWIGAKMEPSGSHCCMNKNVKCNNNATCFKWLNGQVVKDTYMLTRFKEVNVTVRDCLSFARNFHQEPSFVDLVCSLKRPYICQRPAEEQEGEMTHLGWIPIGDFEYAIFYDKKTWKQSVMECFSRYKAHLADFRGMEEVAGIGKYLLIGRPSLENAWIGGHFRSGNWRYLSLDRIIPNETDPETQYPPWPDNNQTLSKQGCLLLDRHLDDGKKLIFLPAHCHRKRSYICSRRIGDDILPPFEIIIIDDVCYTLYYSPKTWFEANKTCHNRNAWLVEVTIEKMDDILYIMGENRTEINHIWIGGKLMDDNHWYWVKSNETIESDIKNIFNGYPPWLDDIFDQKYACLNMDRENHNIPLFYGVYCMTRQPFICEQYDLDPARVLNSNEDTTTTEADRDIWKWKWPQRLNEYVRIKPFFNTTVNKIE